MAFEIGPVLNLRAADAQTWTISVLVGGAGSRMKNLQIACSKATIQEQGTLLASQGSIQIKRYTLAVPLGAAEQKIDYSIDGQTWSFFVPPAGQRANIAFVSCNGFSSGKEAKKVEDKFAMWRCLGEKHQGRPYHLMIMGGDQVYADEIWTKCLEIAKWCEKPRDRRRAAGFNKVMRRQVEKFYFNLYLERWCQAPLSDALASIPTTMMWDDHDIFDGWGSYDEDDQNCPVYKGIFEVARKYFSVFQQQLKEDGTETHPSHVGGAGFSNLHVLNRIAVLTLDARSERTQKRIIEKSSWTKIYDALDGLNPKDCEHIFVVAPVPVVHADFGLLERIGGWALKKADLDDDLRDHWQNAGHREERLRLIHRLFKVMEKKQTRVTILSGDVHVACQGQIDKAKNTGTLTIDQLTASGIIHPPPPGLMGWVLDQLSRKTEQVEPGIVAFMNEFAARREKFILERNFLSLEPDDKGRVWANWIIEGLESPMTKVILPRGYSG